VGRNDLDYEFDTQWKAEECRQKLREAIRTEHIPFLSLPRTAKSKPILGKVRENTFRLRRGSLVNNQFAPLFYGEIVERPKGALVRGRFRMLLFSRIFFLLWFCAFIAIGAFMSVTGFLDLITGSHYVTSGNPWTAALVPLGFIALLLAGVYGFRKWGEKDKAVILNFIEGTLQASPVTASKDGQ
jgi:hypothetical protein